MRNANAVVGSRPGIMTSKVVQVVRNLLQIITVGQHLTHRLRRPEHGGPATAPTRANLLRPPIPNHEEKEYHAEQRGVLATGCGAPSATTGRNASRRGGRTALAGRRGIRCLTRPEREFSCSIIFRSSSVSVSPAAATASRRRCDRKPLRR